MKLLRKCLKLTSANHCIYDTAIESPAEQFTHPSSVAFGEVKCLKKCRGIRVFTQATRELTSATLPFPGSRLRKLCHEVE